MESAEPAYLNLPGWRCVPVYAFPYASLVENKIAETIHYPIVIRSLMPANIPTDPTQWSRQQVYFWLEWCIESFSLPPLDVEQFYMNGRGLCLLKKLDWRDRAPRSGDILYNALQMILQNHRENANSSLVQDNVSTSLLQHASLFEKGPAWARSISSDFHSLGHVLRDNGISMPATNSSDAESTAGGSDEGSISKNGSNPNLAAASSIIKLKPCSEKTDENSAEKINVRLLWDFLQQLLNDTQQRYSGCIMWKEKSKGIFKITDPHRLADLWGKQKNHLNMNFDKMSRALRYYYRVRILQKEPGERHCYRFLRHPNELRHCKQRSLLTKAPLNKNLIGPLECDDVLDMRIKEEVCAPNNSD